MEPTAVAPELPSLGGSLALSFLSLGLVCLLAYVALRWLSKRGLGQGAGPIRIVGRCPVDPKRSLYVVETAGRCFLVGASDGGMNLIAELDPQQLAAPAGSLPAGKAAAGRFAEVLARLRGRSTEIKVPGLAPKREPAADSGGTVSTS
jgi:flagellar biosynthetic protein FliO